jgi:hypothetical protein
MMIEKKEISEILGFNFILTRLSAREDFST